MILGSKSYQGTLFFLNKFIYFCLRWVFVAVHGLSLGGLPFVVVCGLLIAVASLVAEHGL